MLLYKLLPPHNINTSILLPSSKSISNRVLIINALSNSPITPENLSDCDDTVVMKRALTERTKEIDIHAAGTAMRFLTAYFSLTAEEHIITGTERMRHRPIQLLVDALKQFGADIKYTENEGFPPLQIKGKCLTGGPLKLKGNVSSQYITALLIIAPYLKDGIELELIGDIVSKPYINLTLKLMQQFGAQATWIEPNKIKVETTPYQPLPFFVESDWSAASYWYQIAALLPEAEIHLPYLQENSYQGDCKGAEIFRKLGIHTEYQKEGIVIKRVGAPQCKHLEQDFVEIPDLAQTFVVTCALLNIPFHFTGLQSLKIKETDRIEALIKELGKLGYLIQQKDNAVLYWNGERKEPQTNPVIDTYEDHRMAMAFAPASILYPNIKIANPQVVSKSYPSYWDDLQKAGFQLIKE